ncbi:MAG: hypothetical protein LBC68_00280 [Prevotellaceae bacterium]|jgi:hypothetical protein|nr:hypothetical protein [Prevotellaceae bacterium]
MYHLNNILQHSTIFRSAIKATIILVAIIATSACNDSIKRTVTYTVNEPIYMSFSEFRAEPSMSSEQSIIHPGKICVYGDYIFISELTKGIHVIDNRNPASPQSVAFIKLIGNVDIIVKSNLLFADSYIDLVWFDISNPVQPKMLGRLENVFTNVLPVTDNEYPVKEVDYNKGVVVGWETKVITEEEQVSNYHPCMNCLDLGNQEGYSSWSDAGLSSSKVNTMAGSMARFAVHGNNLYVVNNYKLKVFSISENTVLTGTEQQILWNVETIFAYNRNLFLGTSNGLIIYDLYNPNEPSYLSSLSHVVGCDPVVVQNDYAYVTIRGGNLCGQNFNLLDVIDISNPAQPSLKASYTLTSPYGLGIDGNTLFVCDAGLKIFDATDPATIDSHLLKQFSNIEGFDVIPYNNILILIGNDGLYQYDYSNLQDIKQLSVIKVTQ